MVAVDSSGSNAMHSEMDRRGGTGAWITATGTFPLSITISAPARTRASSPAKSLAASASEMWITWSAMPRLYRHSVFGLPVSKAPAETNVSVWRACHLGAILIETLARKALGGQIRQSFGAC